MSRAIFMNKIENSRAYKRMEEDEVEEMIMNNNINIAYYIDSKITLIFKS